VWDAGRDGCYRQAFIRCTVPPTPSQGGRDAGEGKVAAPSDGPPGDGAGDAATAAETDALDGVITVLVFLFVALLLLTSRVIYTSCTPQGRRARLADSEDRADECTEGQATGRGGARLPASTGSPDAPEASDASSQRRRNRARAQGDAVELLRSDEGASTDARRRGRDTTGSAQANDAVPSWVARAGDIMEVERL